MIIVELADKGDVGLRLTEHLTMIMRFTAGIAKLKGASRLLLKYLVDFCQFL